MPSAKDWKPAPDSAEDWTFLRNAARTLAYRIERAPDGGPVRDVAAVPGKKVMGYVQSAKTGRMQPWSRPVQRSRYWQCEIDPAVATYLAQPLKLTMRVAGEEYEFHPDLLVRYRDGRIECEALIPTRGISKGERSLLPFASDALAAEAIALREVAERDVVGTARERNSVEIYADRWTEMTAGDHAAAAAAFGRMGGAATYGTAVEALGGPGLGRARLHALILRGKVGIDLDQPIRKTTPVRWMGGLR